MPSPQHRLFRLALASCAILVIAAAGTVNAQVLELRHLWERFESGKLLINGQVFGPVESQLQEGKPRYNVDYNAFADFDGGISFDYWQLRAGVNFGLLKAILPYLFWNPVIGDNFGGENSRWTGSVGTEFAFQTDPDDYDPTRTFQADNSVYSPQTSISLLVGYWFGEKGKTLRIDTNYFRRGFVDTTDFLTPPLDTATYVRGTFLPTEIPSPERGAMRFTSRNGFSVGVGLASGKYAGSGPISKYLNFLHPTEEELAANDSSIYYGGLSPLLVARYRYDNYIAQLDIAGEDINLGLIYRGFGDWDLEAGAQYLEHIFYRPSRGPNRTRVFLGVRYSPLGPETFETGDEIYTPESDTDGDGIGDGDERLLTRTDPNNADSDGDGLPDGLEVYTYKTNPTISDSDGDGLIDGQEVGGQIRTDPLRVDTDGDGISDGEEINRGTDPLQPGAGERAR